MGGCEIMRFLLTIIIIATFAGCKKNGNLHPFSLYDGTKYFTSTLAISECNVELYWWEGKAENIKFSETISNDITLRVINLLDNFSPMVIEKKLTPIDLEKQLGSVFTTSLPTGVIRMTGRTISIEIKYYDFGGIHKIIVSDNCIIITYGNDDAQKIAEGITKILDAHAK